MTKKRLRNTCASALVCFLASLSLADPAHAGATITVVNNDGPGEGFNDPGPPDLDSTAGGNPGATLGAQRLIAFQFAADRWASILNSPVEIRIDATFDPLFCDASGGTLGSAGANSHHINFIGAPVADTFYAQALANALRGIDLDPSNDITAQFNSTIGTTCLLALSFYYGLDGMGSASTDDFPSTVLHELAHGLGFASLVDDTTGEKFMGFDDAYMRHLEDHTTGTLYPAMTDAERVTASTNTGNLHWTGPEAILCGDTVLTAGRDPGTGHIEMFAPSPQQPGSSVSHFSTTLVPDQVMEPFSVFPPVVVPDVDTCLLVDLGWTLMAPPTTTTTLPPTTTTTTLPPTTTTTLPPTTTTTLPPTTTTTLPPTTTTTLPPPPPLTCNGLPATIVGTNSGEVITGTPGPDVIVARGGNDLVFGRGGNDVICGGPGHDVLLGQNGADKLFGEDGNDAMFGGAGNDSCAGGAGSDAAFGCETTTSVP